MASYVYVTLLCYVKTCHVKLCFVFVKCYDLLLCHVVQCFLLSWDDVICCAGLSYLGSTSLIGIPNLRAMSSTVSLAGEMIPTALAMALAVMGWSPVTMMTLMPASRHLLTASGTFGRGGSISDIKPTNRRPDKGKFSSSGSNSNPMGNWSRGRTRSQKPRTRSPKAPRWS